MNEASNRIRYIDRLDEFARVMNLTDAQLTKECELAVGTLGKSRKPGKDLTKRTIAVILDRYPRLNRQWLITGKGEMMLEELEEPDYITYPLVDTTTAECGPVAGLSDAIVLKGLPKIALPGVPRETAFFIVASGYSMLNAERPELSIPPGSFVGVANPGKGQMVRWGEVYAVATTDGIMIKRLMQSEDKDFVECQSYNSADYPTFKLASRDIYDIARVTCVVPVYVR